MSTTPKTRRSAERVNEILGGCLAYAGKAERLAAAYRSGTITHDDYRNGTAAALMGLRSIGGTK